jgi:Ser/Thr protein kinase RdoA (MazF antagonist)
MSDFYQLSPSEQEERMRELAARALPHWDLAGSSLTLLKMRENAVFRAQSSDGRRYALRIHRHGYHSDAAVVSELMWMQALDTAGIKVPEVMSAASGELFVAVESPGVPEPRQVDLFAWVEGQQLGSVEDKLSADKERATRIFSTVGELAGRVHNQACAWQLPDGFVRHAWDVDGLTGEQPFWGRFWELEALSPSQRTLLQRLRTRMRDDLTAFGRTADNYSMIHADLTPENLMLDGDSVRLIDFDDAGFGWHLFEIATTLYFHLGEDYFDDIQDALISGYRSVRPLSDEELEYLPLFFAARGTTYLGWVHTRSETETARELTPMLVELACGLAEDYLSS